MKKELFPAEIIENSQEANFSTHSVKSKVIYSTIVAFLIGSFCLLPFINVDVGVRSQGFIRPVTEVVQLTTPVSGYIQTLYASENSLIKRGELLVRLETPELTEILRYNEARQQQLDTYLNDLDLLLITDTSAMITSVEFKSARYLRAWLEFKQELANQKQKIDQFNRQLEREKILFERDAISEVALDESLFSFQTTVNQFKLLIEHQKNQWKLDEITFQNEKDQLISESIRLMQELSLTEIRSPLTIPKGKVTAFVGESGSGKTTLVNILQKMYPIESGRISIGDMNLAHIDTQSLRDTVSVVPQKMLHKQNKAAGRVN